MGFNDENVLDFAIGSDLIYAHETIAPLVSTFEQLSGVKDGKTCTTVYMAVIRRFDWEEKFFEGMACHFAQELVKKKQRERRVIERENDQVKMLYINAHTPEFSFLSE